MTRQIEVAKKPTDGVWDWSKCYYAIGERVQISNLDGTLAGVGIVVGHARNRLGRVSYDVRARVGPRSCLVRRCFLEDLCGWRELPLEYRHAETMKQLAGIHCGQLVFPKRAATRKRVRR